MRIGAYETFLVNYLPKRKRVLAVGKPGVGKTYAAMAACRRLGWQFLGLCAALEDPATIRGYPAKGENGKAEHWLFDAIARAFEAKEPTLLFFDDLGMATDATMRSLVRFWQFGQIDGKRLPEQVVIGAATNDIGHGAGVYGMIEPLKNRFDCILQVETHVDDLVGHGLAYNWPAWLLAYFRNSPESIHDWKPEKSMKQGGATPRGWEYVAKWDLDGCDDPEVWEGAVGKGRAVEAHAFKRLANDLPDIDQILLDPDGAPVPENPGAKYMVAMALASRMSGGTFGQAIKYLGKMKQMFRAFSVRDGFRAETARMQAGTLAKDYRKITTSRDFTAWSTGPDGKDILSGYAS